MQNNMREKDRVELSVLKKYGLRFAILAAWEEGLRSRKVAVPPGVSKMLEIARVKISSGCFSVCDVGCDLGRVEAILVSLCASTDLDFCDSWLETLGDCMADDANIEEIQKKVNLPAVKMHYNRFHFDGACGSCGS
ncbi:MAG: hypothetical protein IH576_02620 [Deltaproteobacteria bacterium]|nr:hypothetical protein [Deltaproteobacteria bacterium]